MFFRVTTSFATLLDDTWPYEIGLPAPPAFDWLARSKLLVPFLSRRDLRDETEHEIIIVTPILKIRGFGFHSSPTKEVMSRDTSDAQWLDMMFYELYSE